MYLESFIDGVFQYIKLLLLPISFFIPILFDFKTKIEDLVDTSKTTILEIKSIFLLFAIKSGNVLIGLTLFIIVLFIFRKYHAEQKLNMGNHYHNHTYVYYWMCSNILGYKTCSLILVPVFMQIKLILKDTFSNFYYGEDSVYAEDTENRISITKKNFENKENELINIVISDTYLIEEERLPHLYNSNPTIFIIREKINDSKTRVFSKALIDEINNQICSLQGEVKINLFATMNPKNTYYMTKLLFKKANRTNITRLTVFTQSRGVANDWTFDECGKRVI